MTIEKLRQWVSHHTALTVAVALPVAVFLVVFAFLFLRYQGEQSQQQALRSQMGRLSAIAASPAQRLAEVRREFEAVQGAMPPADLKETDVYETMLRMAQDRGLTANISYRGETQKQVGSTSYRAMSFTLTVSGPFEEVWDLLQELDTRPKEMETLVLGKITLAVAQASSASVDFVIYTQAPKG